MIAIVIVLASAGGFTFANFKSLEKQPTSAPTHVPTRQPTHAPTRQPTRMPTQMPTRQPTSAPTCRLTHCQRRAIDHVLAKAIYKSAQATGALRALIRKIAHGKYAWSENSTLAALHRFMASDVPIIIHLDIANTIPLLVKDIKYRSLFELSRYEEARRVSAESDMFNGAYDKEIPAMRPLYGCLNIGLNKAGQQLAAFAYGDGYFVLNDETVRRRTTMTLADSYVLPETGTLKHCDHLLKQLTESELEEIVEAALTQMCSTGGAKQMSFREIQIHGQVELDRDIVSLHVPSLHKKNNDTMRSLEEFRKENGCKLVFF